jgi:hypothetical protein
LSTHRRHLVSAAHQKNQFINQVHEISLDKTQDSSSTIYNYFVLLNSNHYTTAPINRHQDGFQRQEEEGEEEGFSGIASYMLYLSKCRLTHE